jgi:hypothetical protein
VANNPITIPIKDNTQLITSDFPPHIFHTFRIFNLVAATITVTHQAMQVPGSILFVPVTLEPPPIYISAHFVISNFL